MTRRPLIAKGLWSNRSGDAGGAMGSECMGNDNRVCVDVRMLSGMIELAMVCSKGEGVREGVR